MNTTAPQQGLSIEQALAQAHAHWEAGQSNQAEHLCQQVLQVWPGQSDALQQQIRDLQRSATMDTPASAGSAPEPQRTQQPS